jgi:hypothetical protein
MHAKFLTIYKNLSKDKDHWRRQQENWALPNETAKLTSNDSIFETSGF